MQNLSKSETVAVSDLEKNSISIQAGDPSFKMVRFSLEKESNGSRWTENVSRSEIKISVLLLITKISLSFKIYNISIFNTTCVGSIISS